jgi:tetratricopeptide (TPR) repeat protein
MLSKLQIYCEAIMEASWLAALMAIPLFFNISSTQIFEPDKVFLLRFLAILSGVAYLTKWLAARPGQQKAAAGDVSPGSLLRHPLVLLILAFTATYTLSSVFSITPAASWLGSYRRAQGAATFYCYVILFLVILVGLRSPAQLKRLQHAYILTSLPVAGYGILQHFGADSLPWSNPMQGRSSGSMGNPIFLGAFLMMVIPLTFSRLVTAIRMLRADANRKPGFVLACTSGIVLLLQGLALLYTQSRGPVIGLAVSGYVCLFLFLVLKRIPGKDRFIYPTISAGSGILAPVFVVVVIRMTSGFGRQLCTASAGAAAIAVALIYWIIWRRYHGRNWLWLAWLGQTAALVAIFSVVPVHTITENMRFMPFRHLTEISDNSVNVRRFLWQTGLKAIESGAPSLLPDDKRDRFHYFRPIVGYGPENISFVADGYASPQLVRLHTRESVDRMHNDVFDNLITLGLAGAVLWMILIGAAFYYSLKLLGFSMAGGWKNPFVAFSAVGSVTGILLPWAAGYPYLLGIGGIAGLLAGLVLFAAWSGYRNTYGGFTGDDRQVFILCILGALIAHFVETGVGIAVTSTRTYFFALLALLAVFVVRNWSFAEEPTKKRASRPARSQEDSVLPLALLSSCVVLVLSWCFIVNGSDERSALTLFLQTWFIGYPGLHPRWLLPASLILLLLTICGSLGLIYGELAGRQPQKITFRKMAAITLSLILSVWFMMAMLSVAFWTTRDTPSPLSASFSAESRITLFIVALSLLILAIAWRITRLEVERLSTTIPVRARSIWITALIAIGALGALQELALHPVRADIACRIAGICESSANLGGAIQLYDRATALAPQVVSYWTSLGLAQASAGTGDARLLQDSYQSLRHAVDLNPLNPHSNLALAGIYMQDAERATEPASRNRRLKEAIAFYQTAAQLAPNYPEAYCGLGRCYFLLGDPKRAASLYEKSLQINPSYFRTYLFMGEMHYRLNNLERALQDFEKAARLNWRSIDARRNLGFILAKLGRKEEAVRTYLDALKRAPNDLGLLRRLAILYFSLGESGAGQTYARLAYEATPAAEKGTFEKYVADLKNQ